MYQSAVGATQVNGEIAMCYSISIFNNNCDIKPFINSSMKLNNIALAKNEAERKSYLIDPADVVIVLPGAMGTFSEILAAIYMNKPVVLCNIHIDERSCNYYNGFYELLQQYNLAKHVTLVDFSSTMSQEVVFSQLNKTLEKLAPSKVNISILSQPDRLFNMPSDREAALGAIKKEQDGSIVPCHSDNTVDKSQMRDYVYKV